MSLPLWSHRAWNLCCIVGLYLYAGAAALSTDPSQRFLGNQNDAPSSRDHRGPRQPNIIFILSDDQDHHMSSLDYMPHLQAHLVKEGTLYNNHYCTVALGCPSRASLWAGKHAHNTNITDLKPPYGGYPKFVSQGFNDAYLPLWLQAAGYNTYYTGKLFNAHSTSNYNKPYPRGWNGSDFLLDPYTYDYSNAAMQRNVERWGEDAIHGEPRSYQGQYITDVIADMSMEFLDEAITQRYEKDSSGRPFFLTIAPTAPHCNVKLNTDRSDGYDGKFTEHTADVSPAIPAERHQHLFSDVVVPRTPDFNPDKDNTVSWLKSLPKQNQTDLDSNDHFYRQRLRALQAVDELIPRILLKLEFTGILQETYIVYTSDNGFHIGRHRLQPGKQSAYETDVNVPMIVRGPEVLKGRIETRVSSHVDLASTFLSLAGVDPSVSGPRYGLDGQAMVFHYFPPASEFNDKSTPRGRPSDSLSIPKTYHARDLDQRAEHVNIEMWGTTMPEGEYGQVVYPNNTYKALRVISADDSYNLLYVVWCTNEHELYDLRKDPYAMDNLFDYGNFTAASIDIGTGQPDGTVQERYYTLDKIVARLDALMMVLKTCKGRQCTHPWEVLHKEETVQRLRQALDQAYDEFYLERMPRVKFDRCEEAYTQDAERTMWTGVKESDM